MAIEQARVGEVAARMMGILDQYGYGEDAEITDVVLIVAVDHNGEGVTRVHWSRSPGMSMHAGVGLLTQVQHAMLTGRGEAG